MIGRIESRASRILNELRAMDEGEAKTVSEHAFGDFDNEQWLSRELEELGYEHDDLEELLEDLEGDEDDNR